MLLQEKLQQTNFSSSEKLVVDFILNKQEQIESYSSTKIAEATYTSPSTLIRIAKKLNFSGWIDLKRAFLDEVSYLRTNFQDIDANIPFSSNDSFTVISNKVAQLKIESIHDTQSLIQQKQLDQAVNLLNNQETVKVFTLANLHFLGKEFVYKLRHIQKKAEIYPVQNTMFQEAAMTKAKDCAIIISYSGESDPLFETVRLLKQNQVPIIAITSIGDNKLSGLADVTLHVTTREKSYTKVAGFSSLESISLVLDTLYSCYFSINYNENYKNKINLAQLTESRQIDNQIIQDNEDAKH